MQVPAGHSLPALEAVGRPADDHHLIGLFSGLGFAAFENLIYSQLQVFQTLNATAAAGAPR